MVSDGAFLFHIYIPLGKTLSPSPRTLSEYKQTNYNNNFIVNMLVAVERATCIDNDRTAPHINDPSTS